MKSSGTTFTSAGLASVSVGNIRKTGLSVSCSLRKPALMAGTDVEA